MNTSLKPPTQLVKAAIFLVLLQFSSLAIAKQATKVEFGDVSMEELEMSIYEKDSSANAVILRHVGRLDGHTLKFITHLRVKILDKSGLDWANWTFAVPQKGALEAYTFNLDNGQIIKEKIGSENIHFENVVTNSGNYRARSHYKLFAPNAKAGTVIDIKYFFTGIPYEWRFQERIPLVYGELTLGTNSNIEYGKTYTGYQPLNRVSDNKWIAKDVPALKLEPYINDYSNYLSKFEFQLISIQDYPISKSWQGIGSLLMHYNSFGDVIRGSSFLQSRANEIKKMDISEDEKISLVYSYIKDNLKFNGINQILASDKLSYRFKKEHTGSIADINLCLISMLNKIGVMAEPVVLSTRDNGLLREDRPSINKLNYVVAYIKDKKMFLDAGSEFLIPGVLGQNALNGKGWLISSPSYWIDLDQKTKKNTSMVSQITMEEDGSVNALVVKSFKDYAYIEWKEIIRSGGEEEKYFSNLSKDEEDIEITEFEVIDDEKPLNGKFKINVDMSDRLIELGNEKLFTPVMFFDFITNPFNSTERVYPVDLKFPQKMVGTILIKIDEQSTIKSMPKSTRLSNADQTMNFTLIVNNNNGNINMRYVFELKKAVFGIGEYQELRQFMSQVAKNINEPFLLIPKQ